MALHELRRIRGRALAIYETVSAWLAARRRERGELLADQDEGTEAGGGPPDASGNAHGGGGTVGGVAGAMPVLAALAALGGVQTSQPIDSRAYASSAAGEV